MISERGFMLKAVGAMVVVLTLGFVSAASAQDPEGRSRPAEAEPAGRQAVKTDSAPVIALMKSLSDQVRALTAEVARLRKTIEHNDQTMELLLSEEKLARTEDNIAVAQQRAADLNAAERAQQYRQDHVNEEVILRAGLDRQATEKAVRADIEQRFDEVHAGQAANDKRLASLETEATDLRNHIQDLRRKLSSSGDKGDSQN
jgi:chromosome segregation ATPase